MDVLLVGINPRWSLPLDQSRSESESRRDNGKTFRAYQDQILGEIDPKRVARMDLVPCGTPDGAQVLGVLAKCRERFFDQVVAELRPRVIVTIGRYASEHLYWRHTRVGKAGKRWPGMRAHHAVVEPAGVDGHEYMLVTVLQPCSHVSASRREAAREAVGRAYRLATAHARDSLATE